VDTGQAPPHPFAPSSQEELQLPSPFSVGIRLQSPRPSYRVLPSVSDILIVRTDGVVVVSGVITLMVLTWCGCRVLCCQEAGASGGYADDFEPEGDNGEKDGVRPLAEIAKVRAGVRASGGSHCFLSPHHDRTSGLMCAESTWLDAGDYDRPRWQGR
jgi:hypothetical protein